MYQTIQLIVNFEIDIFENGKSLRDVILDMRIKAAMSLLTRTKASVRAIARKAGFASDAYFVRAFRKRVKTTPAAYRLRTPYSVPKMRSPASPSPGTM